jgi:hypothetical protein
MNIPAGGGGYFRLLPSFFIERALRQLRKRCNPPVAMLYFHPWEFDPEQQKLPLNWLAAARTYVGISRTKERLVTLLGRHQFGRAIDVANRIQSQRLKIPRFDLSAARIPNGAVAPVIPAT